MSILTKLRQIGPGAMVTAAFIGPGTVTTATMAGASYGYTLLWAIVFSTFATIVLQEMSARLGVVTGEGVGENLRRKLGKSPLFYMIASLVISAILIGNGAYEAGNISGASLGFTAYFDDGAKHYFIAAVGILAFILLYTGSYKLIERALILLVTLLGLVFFVSALFSRPDIGAILSHLFIPTIPEGALYLIVGLIGTTVVPYNLFLHASAAKNKWSGTANLPSARLDTVLSVTLGGLITLCIMITSAASFQGQDRSIEGVSDLAFALEPLLGSYSVLFISLGFFAAGLTSAITAPLAAAYAVSEVSGRYKEMSSTGFKLIWGVVLLIGVLFASLRFKPTSVILFSQFANGLLLPIIAIFLLWIMNDKAIMKEHANSRVINILGIVIISVTIVLGLRSILSATNLI